MDAEEPTVTPAPIVDHWRFNVTPTDSGSYSFDVGRNWLMLLAAAIAFVCCGRQ